MVSESEQLVDFTLKNKNCASKLARLLIENCNVKDVSHLQIATSMLEFPPYFSDQPIVDYILYNYGGVTKLFRKKDRYEMLFGVRVHKLQIKDLETNPITSYLYFGDTNFPSNMMDIIKLVDVVEKPAIAKKNAKGKRK